jgi:hypothetical protein
MEGYGKMWHYRRGEVKLQDAKACMRLKGKLNRSLG